MLSLQLVTLVPTGYWMFIHFLIFIFWPNLSLIKTMLQTCGEMVPTYLLFTGKELESVNHADIWLNMLFKFWIAAYVNDVTHEPRVIIAK